jgi:hypothetical protein
MASIRDFINRIKQAKAELIANREADALRIAFDQIALVKLRIQRSGQNSDGGSFLPYTPAYAKQRQKAGYQVGFVDLTRTGRLFASISPRVESSNIFSATIVIEPDNDEGKKILEGLSKKRPNILEPSAQELEIIRAANRRRILSYFNF